MHQQRIAIIGGTGLDSIKELVIHKRHLLQTPFGAPSAAIQEGTLYDQAIFFLPRHGDKHDIPPHQINYRANIDALHSLAVDKILALTAVGGISTDSPPRALVIPDQIIDYTYGRQQTFFDGVDKRVEHIDFTEPFCANTRAELIQAAEKASVKVSAGGVYGVTQGPRLETAAEIRRMAKDGCSVVGMTVMPEAALARELDIQYANCSIVVNWAAGLHPGVITMAEIGKNLDLAYDEVKKLLKSWLTA
ncbi:MAG: S-methyl-5'-thioinosine phosphorylase [Gammaproteobacteria bacterium]